MTKRYGTQKQPCMCNWCCARLATSLTDCKHRWKGFPWLHGKHRISSLRAHPGRKLIGKPSTQLLDTLTYHHDVALTLRAVPSSRRRQALQMVSFKARSGGRALNSVAGDVQMITADLERLHRLSRDVVPQAAPRPYTVERMCIAAGLQSWTQEHIR